MHIFSNSQPRLLAIFTKSATRVQIPHFVWMQTLDN